MYSSLSMESQHEVCDFLLATNRLISLLTAGTPIGHPDRASLDDAVKRLRSCLFVWNSQQQLEPGSMPIEAARPALSIPPMGLNEGAEHDGHTLPSDLVIS